VLGPSSLLVRHLQAHPRDQASWGDFVQRYDPVIYRWSLQRGLQPDEAADITQDVFLRLLSHLAESDRSIGRFRTWLWRIVHNRLQDLLKGHARRKRVAITEAVAEQLLVEGADQELDAALRDADEQVLLERAESLVRSRVLPESWKAYWLTRHEGLTAKHAAAQLGMKVGTVGKQAYRVETMVAEEVRRFPES
jgi:RNA polymerase sigma-70 factor (ECF subfamily)